jgi:hypothetical protein
MLQQSLMSGPGPSLLPTYPTPGPSFPSTYGQPNYPYQYATPIHSINPHPRTLPHRLFHTITAQSTFLALTSHHHLWRVYHLHSLLLPIHILNLYIQAMDPHQCLEVWAVPQCHRMMTVNLLVTCLICY